MRKDRKIQMLSIVALVLAITGMSLGFAAFSSTLSISSSATVTPNSDDFSITFLGLDENGEYTSESSIYPISENNISGNIATISNGKVPTISNMKASFTEPGQSVIYSYKNLNTGLYNIYMKSWVFDLLDGMNDVIECVPAENSDVSSELLSNACQDIDVKVQVYSSDGTELVDGYMRYYFDIFGTSLVSFGDNLMLSPNDYYTTVISIEYASDGARADGDFEVKIANIDVEYGTAPLE
ncbi:MAG: hypothetical protein IJE53_04735 [Bacilli bacterium]|nr:hypothetical protein [Bacilli bacterium]